MASNSSSSPPERYTTVFSEDHEDALKSKRSSITIECSDGYKMIILRPHHPRSGSISASQSGPSSPPSPPPSAPVPAPGSEPNTQASMSGCRKHPDSMPSPLNLSESDTRAQPAPRAWSDSEPGKHPHTNGRRDFDPAPGSPPVSPRSRMPRGIAQLPLSVHARTGRATSRSGRGRSEGPSNSRLRPSLSPQPGVQHKHENATTPLHRAHSHSGPSSLSPPDRNAPNIPRCLCGRLVDRRESYNPNFDEAARYSIEAVVEPRNPSRPSRRRGSGADERLRLEVRDVTRNQGGSAVCYVDASIRGGREGGTCGGVHGSGRRGSRWEDVDRPGSRGIMRDLRRWFSVSRWLFGNKRDDHAHVERSRYRSRSRRTRRH